MHKITKQARDAFEAGRNFRSGDTAVVAGPLKNEGPIFLTLHGNQIARKEGDTITFSMCGWPTPTTRERLKAAGVLVAQRKGQQYYIHPRTRNERPICKDMVYTIKPNGTLETVSL